MPPPTSPLSRPSGRATTFASSLKTKVRENEIMGIFAHWSLTFVCRCFSGDVLFYRNKKGEAVRRPADQYRLKSKSE